MAKSKTAALTKPYRITDGDGFRLKDIDPADTRGLGSEFKERAKLLLQEGVTRLAELQDKLFAQDRWSVLLIFQALDAAGKDSTIKHVLSGVNPQGVEVSSFEAPSAEELDHDYLWRTTRRLPERGRIGIFNRSYYEEVLVVRSPHAPWYVVPADHKWFTHLVVGAAVIEALEQLDLAYPTVDPARQKELRAARAALLAQGRRRR